MAHHHADIVIIGAGIAGLWASNHLKSLGYDVLVLENDAIGGGQTLASQGIIHSGLKYAFAGKISSLAQSISAMPDLWRSALKGEGPVNLSAAKSNAESQILLVPNGIMGGLVQLALGVREIPKNEWPDEIKSSGFKGSAIYMDEPVLDIASVVRALAGDKRSVRSCHPERSEGSHGFEILRCAQNDKIILGDNQITFKKLIITAASSNHEIAQELGHDTGLQTQKRPLLMGLLKPAPFPLYAHLVGMSDKPVATITTHKRQDGSLVWYLGGGVAERAKEDNPQNVIDTAKAAFAKYLPNIDFSQVEWATLPIDRVEGKSEKDGWMPDTPTIHSAGNVLYCWPTKLTFAPMLSNRIVEILEKEGVGPSGTKTDWSFLPEAPFAAAPWDSVSWS